MESTFTKRFKSCMRLSKDGSPFNHLIPIEKKIKITQIHQSSGLNTKSNFNKSQKHTKTHQKELKINSVLSTNLYFPAFNTPDSSKSTTRVLGTIRRHLPKSCLPKDFPEKLTTLNSPLFFKRIIEKDLIKILRNVEKSNANLNSPLLIESSRLIRRIKKNISELS